MRNSVPLLLRLTICLFLFCCLANGSIALAQESAPGVRWELLTMNGSKPNLSATGEGITSYKFDELFNRGKSSVSLVDPTKLPFKIELPVGYTLYNNLVYGITTDAVFTGPTDITFKLPSVRNKETFAQLRILYPQFDYADPKVPKWIDITLEEEISESNARWLKDVDIKPRLPNFDARTLHAFTEENPLVLLVAVRDSSKRRDKLTADLVLTGTASAEVTEGRTFTSDLKLTNKGPATATGITLHAYQVENSASVTPSVGKCRVDAANIYCTFASLEKDQSIDIKIVERCPWYEPDPSRPEQRIGLLGKFFEVGGTERDPFAENNHLDLETQVYRDANQGPVVEIVSPTLFKIFPGPAATVPIHIKASDPDGFVRKVELLDEEKPLGEATVKANGEYEFIYKDVTFGRHWVTVVVTDNLGRFVTQKSEEFFVNGTAKLEITNPKAGTKLNKADGPVTVTIHAIPGGSRLKKVSLDFWDSDATPVGNDDYVVKVKYCGRKCRVQAIAIDERDIETRSEPVDFIIVDPPRPDVRWFEGEYLQPFEPKQTFKVSQLILAYSAVYEDEMMFRANITKLELLANGVSVCSDSAPVFGSAEKCVWTPAPGKYKLQVIATDEDGAVGKSDPIEITIERP
jgi:hypothetical protein